MGDRAYAQVLCRAKDVAAFEGAGPWGTGVLERAEGVSFLVDEETNYGKSFPARAGGRAYVFIAQRYAGGDYDASRLAFEKSMPWCTNRDLAWR